MKMNAAVYVFLPWVFIFGGILVNYIYSLRVKKDFKERKGRTYVRRIPEGMFYGMIVGAGVGLVLGQVVWGMGLCICAGVLVGSFIKRVLPENERVYPEVKNTEEEKASEEE